MGSHKQRVQRKIKKEVKRKLQSQTRPRTAVKRQNRMDEMMRMMFLMKGVQQPNATNTNDLLTAKNIIAKQNAEETRKQREAKQRIKQIKADDEQAKVKAKTDELNKRAEHLSKMEEIQKQNREAQAKLRSIKDEIERNKHAAAVDALNQKYELEQKTLTSLIQSQGLDTEQLDNTELNTVNNKNKEMKRDTASTQQDIKRQSYKSQINEAGELRYRVRTPVAFPEMDEDGIMQIVYEPVEMWKNAEKIDPKTDTILIGIDELNAALNSKNIQETNEKIKQAHIDNAKYEHDAEQREVLYNAEVDARNKRTMDKVYSSLNSGFSSNNSVTEAETLYKAANAKYDEVVNDMDDIEGYSDEENGYDDDENSSDES